MSGLSSTEELDTKDVSTLDLVYTIWPPTASYNHNLEERRPGQKAERAAPVGPDGPNSLSHKLAGQRRHSE